jgi:hypothetical protein
MVNLVGSIHVNTDDAHEIPFDSDVWLALVSGRRSVAEVSQRVASLLPDGDGSASPQAAGVGFLAGVARDAALPSCDWRIEAGWCDTSGSEDSFYRLEHYEQFGDALERPFPDSSGPDGKWFVLNRQGEPVACVDIDQFRLLTAGSDAWMPCGSKHTALVRGMELDAGQGEPTSLGLSVYLSKFNRKERFFVVADATGEESGELHEPSLHLTEGFRSRLGDAIGTEVPAHAWAAVDYHLNWLHAALQWKAGATHPYQRGELASRFAVGGVELVSGNQEDVDLIVSWTGVGGVAQVVFVEAKAYGSWANSQMGHKIPRLTAIVEQARSAGLDVEPRLVLSSPKRPVKLRTDDWPAWALTRDGGLRWMRLAAAGPRLGVERCDDSGLRSSTGGSWRFNEG